MIHYTYWIKDLLNELYYHGVHTSEDPYDINIYSGSSKSLQSAIKQYGIKNFEKRINKIFDTREEANLWEAKVHAKLDVANNPKFYNNVNASGKLLTNNKTTVVDTDGNTFLVSTNDPRYLSGELRDIASLVNEGTTWDQDRKDALSKKRLGNNHFKNKTYDYCKTKMSGTKNPKFDGIYCIKGFEFTSTTEAGVYFGVNRTTINRWMVSRDDCYKRELTKEDKKKYFKICVDDEYYNSANEVSKALGIHINTVYNRLNSDKWPNYILQQF